jgi:hypothetical protein
VGHRRAGHRGEQLGREIGPALARGEAVQLQCQARRKDNSTFLAFVRGRARTRVRGERR